jgi:hypothetical protein
LLEKSPMPPTLSEVALPGGWTQVLNFCWMKQINHHPTNRDEDS